MGGVGAKPSTVRLQNKLGRLFKNSSGEAQKKFKPEGR
jgi:hypothetical protein